MIPFCAYTQSISSCDEAQAMESSGAYKCVCEQRAKPATKSQLERRRVCLFLFSILLLDSVSAKPLLLVPKHSWTDGTPILIANCGKINCGKENVEQLKINLYQIKPKTDWIKNSELLDWVFDPSYPQDIYALASLSELQTGLYCLKNDSFEEVGYFPYSFNTREAKLNLQEVFFENAWHTWLIVILKNELKKTDILIFDVSHAPTGVHANSGDLKANSNSNQKLNPIKILKSYESIINIETTPKCIKLANNKWYLLLGGNVEEKAALALIPIENFEQKSSLVYKINFKGLITAITAVDSEQLGIVDKFLVIITDNSRQHSDSLWSFEPKEFSTTPIFNSQKISAFKTRHYRQNLLALKSLQNPSVDLYAFDDGEAGDEGLVVFNNKSGRLLPVSLKPKKIAAVFIRFGRLILVPEDANLLPTCWSLTSKGLIPITINFKTLVQAAAESLTQVVSSKPNNVERENNVSNVSKIIAAKILWDPKEQQEILITLNDSCQLKVLNAKINHDKYGRMSWRKY